MKKIIISQKPFSLPKSSANLLQKYLDRLRIFVKKNHIDYELLNDIEDRIAEKISSLDVSQIDHEFMINFIDSLGEPQQIFEDEDLHNSINIPLPDLPDLKNVKEKIETSGKFLGNNFAKFSDYLVKKVSKISQDLAEKKAVKKAKKIITPPKTNTEKTIEEEKKLSNFSILNGFKFMLNNLKNIINWTFKMILKLLKNLKNILFWILGKAWLAFGFLLSAVASIWLILALPVFVSLSDFSINNQQIFAAIPTIAAYGFGLALFGFLIISIKSLSGVLQKKWIPSSLVFLAFFALVSGVIVTIYSATETAKYYSKSESKTITETFEIENLSQPITINGLNSLNEIQFFGEKVTPANNRIEIKSTTDELLTIKTIATTLGSKNAAQLLHPITFEQQGSTITAKFETEEKFSSPVPFTFLEFKSTIYLPKNAKISDNIWQDFSWWRFSSDLNQCQNQALFFDENNKLTCDAQIQLEQDLIEKDAEKNEEKIEENLENEIDEAQ